MGLDSGADGTRQDWKNFSYPNLIAREGDLECYGYLKVQANET